MGVQPSRVLEKRAKRQRNLPLLIPFGAGWKRAGASQHAAPVLDKGLLAEERMILRQWTSNRRHDATLSALRHRDAGDRSILSLSVLGSLVNIAHFRDLFRELGCFVVYSSSLI